MSDAPRIAYGLVSGSYSDYSVHAIFSTYAAAAAAADRLNAVPRMTRRHMDDCEVQPFIMDPTPEQLDAKGGVEVHIDEGGNVVPDPPLHQRRHDEGPFAPPRDYTEWRTAAEYAEGATPARRFVGYGIDAERARRAADEYRCMVLMSEQPAA